MVKTIAPGIDNFRSKTALLNGTRIHYWIGGNPDGEPVLLWHGFHWTAHSWYKVMPLMAQAGYSVLAPDMRGYGDSDKPAGTGGYDARALAEEFRALVRQIEFGRGKKLLLVSHDMGAHPALLWAGDHADDISGLVYMEVPTMLEEFLAKILVYTPDWRARPPHRRRSAGLRPEVVRTGGGPRIHDYRLAGAEVAASSMSLAVSLG